MKTAMIGHPHTRGSIMFNQTHYGITKDAMRCARWALNIGWTWEQVMEDLRVTYEARKAYFERVTH